MILILETVSLRYISTKNVFLTISLSLYLYLKPTLFSTSIPPPIHGLGNAAPVYTSIGSKTVLFQHTKFTTEFRLTHAYRNGVRHRIFNFVSGAVAYKHELGDVPGKSVTFHARDLAIARTRFINDYFSTTSPCNVVCSYLTC